MKNTLILLLSRGFARGILILLFTLSWSNLTLANDNSKNQYICTIFEPDKDKLEVRVNPENQHYVHLLVDGIHKLEMQWWDWTLNLSLREMGQMKEKLGAASATQFKLRSRDPDISVYCSKE